MSIMWQIIWAALAFVADASNASPQAPTCFDIQCADIQCLSPFKLRRLDDQCCPICWADDDEIKLDRHTALNEPSPYRTEVHPAAPTTCGGAFCFKPFCAAGYTVGHEQGRCCSVCVPGR
mmetsp:Transcript_127158/g.254094  ORF Transcript_127158/g.254094 Transcript_127158/m.254094 type:complete len:120 (+) Transcript_127158:97-456(+)